jgi:hypothetical protein
MSKKVHDLKAMENKAFQAKQYMVAEDYAYDSEQQEALERQIHHNKIMAKMETEESKVVQKLQSFMNTLLKRIQRDRDEQLSHRKSDSQTLIQRNKNVL